MILLRDDVMQPIVDKRGSTTFFDFVQGKPKIVLSEFRQNVFKGFHFQTDPWTKKVIYLLRGSILDFSVCLMDTSDFGVVHFKIIRAPATFEIPCGYAHGVYAMTNVALIYDFIPYWDIESTHSVLWKDDDLLIPWNTLLYPHEQDDLLISEKDQNGMTLKEIKKNGYVFRGDKTN